MSKEIRVSLAGSQVRIDVDPDSELLNPLHRIFLTNVLSFDPNEEGHGYILTKSTSLLSDLMEAIRHLEEGGFVLRLNRAAEAILSKVRSDKAELAMARKVGAKLKEHPAKKAEVPGFKRPLKAYQIPAVIHLLNVAHGANFSVPGSGKTAIVLATFAILRRQKVVDKLLVVAPRAAFMPWEDEVAACFARPLRSVRIVGSKPKRAKLYKAASEGGELILITYQMASNDVSELASLLRRHKIMIVLDESHNIKRLEGGKWAESVIGLAPLATKRAILTGTPVPNSILDLWSQIEFLWNRKRSALLRGSLACS